MAGKSTGVHGAGRKVPDLVRGEIGRRFKVLRNRAGLGMQEAADQLQRGRSTIQRIEDGEEAVRFKDSDVKAMLELYEASEEETQLMLALTAETRKVKGAPKNWFHAYTDTEIPDWFRPYMRLESEAETIREYAGETVPGILQTRQYAETMMRRPEGYLTDEQDIEQRVKVRMERQGLLTKPRAPRMEFILSQAVLLRAPDGSEAAVEQLRHLATIGERANVSVRVVRFKAGIHGGMAASPFSLLDFPNHPVTGGPLSPATAYFESLRGAMYIREPEDVEDYRKAWADLVKRSLDEEASKELITDVIKEYTGDTS